MAVNCGGKSGLGNTRANTRTNANRFDNDTRPKSAASPAKSFAYWKCIGGTEWVFLKLEQPSSMVSRWNTCPEHLSQFRTPSHPRESGGPQGGLMCWKNLMKMMMKVSPRCWPKTRRTTKKGGPRSRKPFQGGGCCYGCGPFFFLSALGGIAPVLVGKAPITTTTTTTPEITDPREGAAEDPAFVSRTRTKVKQLRATLQLHGDAGPDSEMSKDD